jgi:DNA-binding phage protein
MPSVNYNEDLKVRLGSKKYASVYLETAFRASCEDQDWAAFGQALRNVIDAQGRDVAEFARNSGVSRQHLYLLGKKSNPTISTLVQILDELDLSIGILPQSESRRKSA